jgi:hypothetical protein
MSRRASPPPTSASSGGTYYPPSTAPSVASRKQKQESRAGSRVEKPEEVVERQTHNHQQHQQHQQQQHQQQQQAQQHIHNFQQQYNSNVHNTHRSHNHTQPRQQTHQHSSADAGFFQEAPRLGNQFTQDDAFQRTLTRQYYFISFFCFCFVVFSHYCTVICRFNSLVASNYRVVFNVPR